MGFSPRGLHYGATFSPYVDPRELKLAARAWCAAFSLIEIMIATIILGFGLLMIGAVLPIAWKGSLDASAFTTAEGASKTAKYYVTAKCRVDGMRALFGNINHDPLAVDADGPDSIATPIFADRDGVSYSFLGDYDTIDDINGDDIADPLVHALHLENWAMDTASAFILASNSPNDRSVPESPTLIDSNLGGVGIPADLSVFAGGPYDPLGMGVAIGAPVMKLRERVYPPIPDSLTPEDVNQWSDVLNSRGFAWAVFHRLARPPRSPTDPRYFHMYYVTLRRGNNTSRYARQDPLNGSIVPTAPPQALADTEDVMFPIAWRVPLLMIESPNGVPAIAFAGAVDADVGANLVGALNPALAPPYPVNNGLCKVADMFPRGAVLIDEGNGNVYQVREREFIESASGRTDELARLTLDTEVTIIDLVGGPGALLGPERNRVVWVFPPSVSAGARAAGAVRFTGPNPVIDIRVETLTLMP